MKVFKGFEEATGIKNPVVTTGSFDGVHIGHKTILNRLRMLARQYDGESVLITFHPHPRKVLYPESAGKGLKLINSQEEKLKLLRETGLDNVIIVEFTKEFSKIKSEQFVSEYLHGLLKSKVIVVGFNHHFGFNKEGNYKHLWEWRSKYNFEAEEIPEQEVQHETVSSTKIRKAISEGYIQRANAYLDHYYLVLGNPEKFEFSGSTEMPPLVRIPVFEECKLLPAAGLYAVTVISHQLNSKGMAITSDCPDQKPELLVHIFDNMDAFIDINTSVLFHKKIHGAVELSDAGTAHMLNAALGEISELIY